jgi:hypothetical protein
VDHLHEVAGAAGADVGDAGNAVDDRGDGLEDGPRVLYASTEPPGMIDGPLSAPSSPPEIRRRRS